MEACYFNSRPKGNNKEEKEKKICCYLGNQIVILEQKKICETLMIV